MGENLTVRVTDKKNARLDKFISENFADITRSQAAHLIEDELVWVNGKSTNKKYLPVEGDEIKVILPSEKTIKAQDIPLSIVYEDDDVLVVDKPQGMVVHPAAGNDENTLVNALLFHCKHHLSDINGEMRPGILHRIDKDTSGLLLVAKTNDAHVATKFVKIMPHITRGTISIIGQRFYNNSDTFWAISLIGDIFKSGRISFAGCFFDGTHNIFIRHICRTCFCYNITKT